MFYRRFPRENPKKKTIQESNKIHWANVTFLSDLNSITFTLGCVRGKVHSRSERGNLGVEPVQGWADIDTGEVLRI